MITVREFAGSRSIRLDADQRYLFTRELNRIRRRFPATKGAPRLMAPDCTVIIQEKGKPRKEYRLYGRAILLDAKTNKKWQFYFGLLLLDWLYP